MAISLSYKKITTEIVLYCFILFRMYKASLFQKHSHVQPNLLIGLDPAKFTFIREFM